MVISGNRWLFDSKSNLALAGGSVGWSVVLYAKRSQVRFPVRARTRGNQLKFLYLSQINKHILGYRLKKKNQTWILYSSFWFLRPTFGWMCQWEFLTDLLWFWYNCTYHVFCNRIKIPRLWKERLLGILEGQLESQRLRSQEKVVSVQRASLLVLAAVSLGMLEDPWCPNM